MTEAERALLLNARASDNPTGPILEFNLPSGTFKLEAVDGKLVTSGTLTPTNAAQKFFERVGQNVIDYLRATRT